MESASIDDTDLEKWDVCALKGERTSIETDRSRDGLKAQNFSYAMKRIALETKNEHHT